MIKELDFKIKSALFARLSKISYNNKEMAESQAEVWGFTSTKFYDKDGAQAYLFSNDTDMVIACRGTEPTKWSDIKSDINALPVRSENVSRVHKGFKDAVDELWPNIEIDLIKTEGDKTIWLCGHSLGASMATIMASRLKHNVNLNNPLELYTYGSPRVGWLGYIHNVNVIHYRWKNNNDIVTTVPLALMGYRHHGEEHYINAYGQLRSPTGWQRVKDKFRGLWMGLKKGKIDSFSDHSIDEYISHIESSIDRTTSNNS
tara:strand:+ start:15 stop:791 length:777 start_codon:yes stop_codon:yes gene_type:complete